jgi:hypothetical protein
MQVWESVSQALLEQFLAADCHPLIVETNRLIPD